MVDPKNWPCAMREAAEVFERFLVLVAKFERFELRTAIKRLKRLERTGPRGERSKAIGTTDFLWSSVIRAPEFASVSCYLSIAYTVPGIAENLLGLSEASCRVVPQHFSHDL
jgi:hypothetical protein